MKHKTALSIVFSVMMTIALATQGSGLSIASLSQTQGPVAGGNNITVNGTDFIKDEDDEIIQVSTDHRHSMALSKSGRVYAWGYNSIGQLGTGDQIDRTTPYDITSQFGGEKIVKIVAGHYHSMALTESGKVYTWGNNSLGELGTGDGVITYDSPQDITVQFGSEIVTDITTKAYTSFALAKSGKLFAWGANWTGQLVTGDTTNQFVPIDMTAKFGSERVVQIGSGYDHLVFLTASGKVYAAGDNTHGQLGTGDSLNHLTLQDITAKFSSRVVKIDANYYNNMALTEDNKLYVWGQGNFGQLGTGSTVNQAVPFDVTGQFPSSETIESIYMGGMHAVATTASNQVYTWGLNDYGQLSDGTFTNRSTPQNITANFNGETIKYMSAGHFSNLAITDSGKILVWGYNLYNELGTGNTTNYSLAQDTTASFSLGTYPVTQVESIYFSSSKVQTFEILDANTISLTVPAHAAGFVDIIINDIYGGVTTLSNGYEYINYVINVPNTGA